jgi:imidazole glycerol-phosphate synthase subunit HisH
VTASEIANARQAPGPSPAAGGPRIAIVDYGMGNLRSVQKALERGGASPQRTRDPRAITSADGIVLPGVGAFPRAMANLRELGLEQPLRDAATNGVPVLGICLGMQLLFERSSENEGADGFGFLPGGVERLPAPGLKVPLIGWNAVSWSRESPLTAGLPEHCPFYFVHSFAPVRVGERDAVGSADYGERFVCAVERENIFGVQFHPEKSSADGLRLLANFAKVCAPVAVRG